MPLSRLSLGVVGAIGIVAGVMLAMAAMPWLAESSYADGQIEEGLSGCHTKATLKLVFGGDLELPWINIVLDLTIIWITLFVSINIFVFKNEQCFLWSHIRRNYCFTEAQTWSGQGLCTLLRVTYAFLLTPFACAQMFIASMSSSLTLFTSAYMTVNPNEVGRYLHFIGISIAVIIALAAVAASL